MSDGDDRRFVVGRFDLEESLLHAPVGAGETVAERSAARAGPVDGEQGCFGQAFKVRPRRIVRLERLECIHQHAQVVVELGCARIDAHQPEDRVRLPLELCEACPHVHARAEPRCRKRFPRSCRSRRTDPAQGG